MCSGSGRYDACVHVPKSFWGSMEEVKVPIFSLLNAIRWIIDDSSIMNKIVICSKLCIILHTCPAQWGIRLKKPYISTGICLLTYRHAGMYCDITRIRYWKTCLYMAETWKRCPWCSMFLQSHPRGVHIVQQLLYVVNDFHSRHIKIVL